MGSAKISLQSVRMKIILLNDFHPERHTNAICCNFSFLFLKKGLNLILHCSCQIEFHFLSAHETLAHFINKQNSFIQQVPFGEKLEHIFRVSIHIYFAGHSFTALCATSISRSDKKQYAETWRAVLYEESIHV